MQRVWRRTCASSSAPASTLAPALGCRRSTSALEIALEARNDALVLLLLCNGYDPTLNYAALWISRFDPDAGTWWTCSWSGAPTYTVWDFATFSTVTIRTFGTRRVLTDAGPKLAVKPQPSHFERRSAGHAYP